MKDERQEHLVLDLQKQTAVKFLENLEIEVLGSGRVWRPGYGAALNDVQRQPRSANVVAASVVAFADGIFGQQKEDLLNSTLLAQLAANRKHDRVKDTIKWYELYEACLRNSGGASSSSAPVVDCSRIKDQAQIE